VIGFEASPASLRPAVQKVLGLLNLRTKSDLRGLSAILVETGAFWRNGLAEVTPSLNVILVERNQCQATFLSLHRWRDNGHDRLTILVTASSRACPTSISCVVPLINVLPPLCCGDLRRQDNIPQIVIFVFSILTLQRLRSIDAKLFSRIASLYPYLATLGSLLLLKRVQLSALHKQARQIRLILEELSLFMLV
jgi:hypothetical protein